MITTPQIEELDALAQGLRTNMILPAATVAMLTAELLQRRAGDTSPGASQRHETTTPRIYTVAEYDADPEAGTPVCCMCERRLGIKRAVFSPTGRDEWWCDGCGRSVVTAP